MSKRLSLVLRHDPGRIGLTLDAAGWVRVDDLLAALAAHGLPVSAAELAEVVATNDKKRFAFDDTGAQIRASQGHSVAVELGLASVTPPEVLYHGTVARFLPAIEREGLRPMSRTKVHLSATRDTAVTVARRRGVPVILLVDAAGLAAAGHEFQVSANGVWLTDSVPPDHLRRA